MAHLHDPLQPLAGAWKVNCLLLVVLREAVEEGEVQDRQSLA